MKTNQILVATVLVTAACTLGPDPVRPQTAADEVDRFVNDASASADFTDRIDPWWHSFGDHTTADLVESALRNNADLKVAAANVLEAEASLRTSKATRWPSLDYAVSGTKSETAFNLPGQGLISVEAETYSAEIGLSYQIDLFGRLKRTRQSSWASLLAEEAAAETVMHAVVANVVRARVQVATAQRSLGIAGTLRDSWKQTLDVVESRYRSGLVRAMELHLARENHAAVEESVVQLEASLALANHALDVLVGRRPASAGTLPETLAELPGLEPVPAGVPVRLLDRRPDLRTAELRLEAATHGVGIALADLYPSLSFSASYGTRSESLSDLLDLDNAVYNLLANLAGPLFEGGRRRAAVDAAEARLQAAAASYEGQVLQAMREVEDALVSDRANRRRIEFSERRVHEARAADTLARERYGRGVETLLTVLETERRLKSAEVAYASARADVWNTRIDLFLALGGDWSPPEPTTILDPTETQPESNHNEVF